MAFSIPRSYTDYGSSNAIATELEALAGDLESMNGQFSGSFSNIEAARAGINFGDWDDSTQNQFEDYLTGTVLAALDVVASNLDAGMAAMMGSVEGIKGEVSSLATAQEAYVQHLAAEPTKTITTYYDKNGNTVSSPHEGGSSYTTINPAWDKWDKSCYQQELAMDGMFSSIDAGFADLASITFSPTGTPQIGHGGAGAGEGNQPDDSTETEEVPPVFDEMEEKINATSHQEKMLWLLIWLLIQRLLEKKQKALLIDVLEMQQYSYHRIKLMKCLLLENN